MALERQETALEQREETPNKNKKERRKNSKEVGESLDNFGITKALIEEAQTASDKKLEIASCAELYEKNPALVLLIKGVSEYFNVPEPLLYAVFEHESNFKHGLVGDPHLKDRSIGIGQFRKMTWEEIMAKNTKEFVEFRKFVDKYYPGRKFERGENILVDIAATAAYLKYLGGKRTKFDKLTEHRIVYLRARYVGDKNAKEQMLHHMNGNLSEVDPKYAKFLETYKKYKSTQEEAKNLIPAN